MYFVLVLSQQILVFLDWVIVQNNIELHKEKKLQSNLKEQSKLIISLGEAKKEVIEVAEKLEKVNTDLEQKVNRAEAFWV